jgi:hypothetical protein
MLVVVDVSAQMTPAIQDSHFPARVRQHSRQGGACKAGTNNNVIGLHPP